MRGVGGRWVGLASLPPLAPEPGNPTTGKPPRGSQQPFPDLASACPLVPSATVLQPHPAPPPPSPRPSQSPPGAGFSRKPRKPPALLLTTPTPNIKLVISVSATLWPEAGEGLE